MNTVTWQWTQADQEAWYQLALDAPEYRDKCRNYQTGWALAGGFLALVAAIGTVSHWLLALGMTLCGAALAFVLAGVFLRLTARQGRRRWFQAQAKDPDIQKCYTLILEPDGVRVVLTNSEHWYRWCVIEQAELLRHGFLRFSIEGQVWHLPPSAFTDTLQRDTFLANFAQLQKSEGAAQVSGGWWRQGQGTVG